MPSTPNQQVFPLYGLQSMMAAHRFKTSPQDITMRNIRRRSHLCGILLPRLGWPFRGSFAGLAAAEGFPLFNGKDLTGWHGMKSINPYNGRDEVGGARRQAQGRYEDAFKHWSVDNGELVSDGKRLSHHRQRIRRHRALIDYKTVPKADSGIYLRLTPQVQIWDSPRRRQWDRGADKGSGGLYNNAQFAGADPLVLGFVRRMEPLPHYSGRRTYHSLSQRQAGRRSRPLKTSGIAT